MTITQPETNLLIHMLENVTLLSSKFTNDLLTKTTGIQLSNYLLYIYPVRCKLHQHFNANLILDIRAFLLEQKINTTDHIHGQSIVTTSDLFLFKARVESYINQIHLTPGFTNAFPKIIQNTRYSFH